MNTTGWPGLAFCTTLILVSSFRSPAFSQEPPVKAFLEAAKAGNIDAVNAALKAGVDVNVKTNGDWTALHAAAERGHAHMVKRLVEAGAKANVKESMGATPLHWAAVRGPREAVDILIRAGADVNAWCVQMDTPLGAAAAAGEVGIAEALLDAKADVNGGQQMPPLALAAKYGQADMIRLLVKRGADLNETRYPLLHWAGKPNAAKALLEAGAKVDARDSKGATALHLTSGAWIPSAETVKILIEAKADVHARDQKGSTPLHEAIKQKQFDIAKVLVAAGAEVEAKDQRGNTPLSLAEQAGPDFAALLKGAGAKEDGRPELLKAVEAKDLKQVKALLQGGADAKVKGPAGTTPVHAASASGEKEILAELIRAGAAVDELNEKGLRPLHVAANGAVAEQLIAAGAAVNPKAGDPSHVSPVYVAAVEGRAEVVRTLIQHKVDLRQPERIDLLAWAAYAGRVEVVEVLLEAGLPPNPKNPDRSESALHVAAQGGIADMESPKHVTVEDRLKIARLLLDKGADVNAGTQVGYFFDCTPLMGAATSGSVELAKLLLDKGARINAASSSGMFQGSTALHGAAEAGHADVVKLLLERKADVNALTGKGHFKGVKSPLDLSSRPAVQKLLVEADGKSAAELQAQKK
jgi:ankyrin repeat protein